MVYLHRSELEVKLVLYDGFYWMNCFQLTKRAAFLREMTGKCREEDHWTEFNRVLSFPLWSESTNVLTSGWFGGELVQTFLTAAVR